MVLLVSIILLTCLPLQPLIGLPKQQQQPFLILSRKEQPKCLDPADAPVVLLGHFPGLLAASLYRAELFIVRSPALEAFHGFSWLLLFLSY